MQLWVWKTNERDRSWMERKKTPCEKRGKNNAGESRADARRYFFPPSPQVVLELALRTFARMPCLILPWAWSFSLSPLSFSVSVSPLSPLSYPPILAVLHADSLPDHYLAPFSISCLAAQFKGFLSLMSWFVVSRRWQWRKKGPPSLARSLPRSRPRSARHDARLRTTQNAYLRTTHTSS